MYSLSFLIVELEIARTTLLDVFEVSNGIPNGPRSCASWSCWIIRRTVFRRYGDKHPGGGFLLPPTYKVGAIRDSFQKITDLGIGNKARFLLVFIGNETPVGLWRNKAADFPDMKLVQYVNYFRGDRFGHSRCLWITAPAEGKKERVRRARTWKN
jgi:hypothetical protein